MGEAIALPPMRTDENGPGAAADAFAANRLLSSLPTKVGADQPQSAPTERRVEMLDSRRVFVAVSPAMREVRRQIEQVAGIDAPVLLLGESGSGKEVMAQLIHKLSQRASLTFLKVNCAALPVELLESELFGYAAGAFTGARQAKAGKFEACHKGTLLLDEIAEMPIAPQAKLLHVLQDGEFMRLGTNSPVRVDVRVLAATNVNVHEAVQTGTFRSDLYYRLNVFTIRVPPLRERKEDMPHLLSYMMGIWSASYGRPRLPITRRMLEACATYPWPGNVRELESFVKRYLVLGDEDLALRQLDGEQELRREPPAKGRAAGASTAEPDGTGLKDLVRGLKQETERAAILKALERTNGCKQRAAGLLGISLRALHYKIRHYGITRRYGAAPSSWTEAPSGGETVSAGLRSWPQPDCAIPE
jgi:two-component system, NtrC family, response regulator AtoC